ncbi:unnamed protein product [Peniophora sp. CBMAI 1063]|nr:unnamed protein product [Peniophora sp. CBMAI 1063]
MTRSDIRMDEHAKERAPAYDDTRPAQLRDLGLSLLGRFESHGELEVAYLDYAVLMLNIAVELTPTMHPSKPWRLYDLGVALGTRSQRLGELPDIERAIAAYAHAVELTPMGHPLKPERLRGFGIALRDRFRNLGELKDLEESIAVVQRAIELTPEGHPAKAGQLHDIGCFLIDRFRNLGELRDLEQSIAVMQRAIELTPEGHLDKAKQLQNLGGSLNDRFRTLGELRDLEESIAVMQRAVELTPEGHPDKAIRLHDLSIILRDRFQNLGELRDLEESIAVVQRAINLTPEGHPDKAAQLHSLGGSLNDRFLSLGELRDLEESIAVVRRAIELTPEGHPAKAGQLHDLGRFLIDRFRNLGELMDLEESIAVMQRALELTPDGHPRKAIRMQNLGISLGVRFQSLGELRDLEESIATVQRASELTPEGHPDEVWHKVTLGYSYTERFKRNPSKANLDAALSCFIEATACSTGSISKRWESAQKCIRLLLDDRGEFGSVDSLLLAHSRALDLLPAIVWLGHGLERRYHECAKIGSAVSDAVHTAIYNDALPYAVGWLEAGRAFVWFQLLSLRMPIDDLKGHHPDLAERLESVSKALQYAESSSSHRFSVADFPALEYSVDAAADRHRRLAIQYDETLRSIRRCSGFEDFKRSPKLDALLPALEYTGGPVVFINVNPTSCDVVVLCLDGTMTRITLPQLTTRRAQNLRDLWTRQLKIAHTRVRRAMAPEQFTARGTGSIFCQILARLWAWVVQPILGRLNLLKQTPNEVSHITWCPTGPLTQLPLHAAGIYDTEQEYKPHTYDFVASSYTPSLSVILQNSRGSRQQVAAQPNLLLIAQPDTPGLSPLPGTTKECARICAVLPDAATTLLEHKGATVGHTLNIMAQHPWVHLACHGRQDPTDPTKSAFALYDGPLTLLALMNTVADNAELAFLSACQTAVGDEKIPEESAHLAAGMLVVGFKGVVATMWSIGDEDAPVVAEAYYKKLIELRSSGAVKAGTGAAYALHEAVKVLREKIGEQNVVKWAPFVHFGV